MLCYCCYCYELFRLFLRLIHTHIYIYISSYRLSRHSPGDRRRRRRHQRQGPRPKFLCQEGEQLTFLLSSLVLPALEDGPGVVGGGDVGDQGVC